MIVEKLAHATVTRLVPVDLDRRTSIKVGPACLVPELSSRGVALTAGNDLFTYSRVRSCVLGSAHLLQMEPGMPPKLGELPSSEAAEGQRAECLDD